MLLRPFDDIFVYNIPKTDSNGKEHGVSLLSLPNSNRIRVYNHGQILEQAYYHRSGKMAVVQLYNAEGYQVYACKFDEDYRKHGKETCTRGKRLGIWSIIWEHGEMMRSLERLDDDGIPPQNLLNYGYHLTIDEMEDNVYRLKNKQIFS